MNKRKVLLWEVVGFVFAVIAGSLLHFCFEWSGGFRPTAFLCAVNESVWEHLKLAFWPLILFSILEYFLWGKEHKNFWPAKAIAAYAAPIFIIVSFYTYTAILGTHNLIIDIAIFVLAVLISFWLSYKIITDNKDYSRYNALAILLIILAAVLFILFTYNPPRLDLFKDHNGSYGIPAKKQ